MKNSILEFIKKEIKGFFSFIYWCVVIGIVSSYSGFQNTVLIVLAKVYGPLNEDAVPLRIAIPVKNGETSVTAAKEGFPYPVGTPIPTNHK